MAFAMRTMKAHVRAGRLVLDEPTGLPEGTEVQLALIDDPDLDPRERARLMEAIEAGELDVERGDHADGFALVAELRGREAAGR